MTVNISDIDFFVEWMNPPHTIGENCVFNAVEMKPLVKDLIDAYTDPNIKNLSITAVAEYDCGEVLVEHFQTGKTANHTPDAPEYYLKGEGTVLVPEHTSDTWEVLSRANNLDVWYTGEPDDDKTTIEVTFGDATDGGKQFVFGTNG